MSERWTWVRGFAGMYEVSDHGRVRSVDRHFARRASTRHPFGLRRFYPGKMLKACPTSSGHLVINLGRHKRTVSVHRLVLEAFVGGRAQGAWRALTETTISRTTTSRI